MQIPLKIECVASLTGLGLKAVPRFCEFGYCSCLYHFCLALPAAFTQPGDYFVAHPCISSPEGVTQEGPTHHDAAPAICGQANERQREENVGGRRAGGVKAAAAAVLDAPPQRRTMRRMMIGILIWARTDADGVAFLARGGHDMRISIGGQVSHLGTIHK